MKFFIVLLAVAGLAAAGPTKSLQDDFQQIVALIPIADIRQIVCKYVKTDAEVQHVLEYLRGPEWAALVDEVRQKQAVKDLKQFLSDNGIDADALIQHIHDIINGNGCSSRSHRSPRSVRSMIDEIMAIFPLDAIMDKNDELLTNSADFQKFYEAVSGDECHQMVIEVEAIPEVQRLRGKLIDMGIDVAAVEQFFDDLLGW